MQWGFFSVTHIVSLVMVGVITVGLHFLLRNRSEKTQTVVLGSLSFLGIASIIYNLIAWNCPLENLPLHLCSFNAMVLPFVVFTKNKALGNMLLLWCLGAIAALVLNTEMAETELLGWPFFFYYFPHVVEIAIPLLMVSLGKVRKDPKCIFSTVGITMGLYTLVHFINLGLNKLFIAQDIRNLSGEIILSNYMYTVKPNNPLSDLFYGWVGEYWHMYLALPILVVYLLLVYAPELLRLLKKKEEVSA